MLLPSVVCKVSATAVLNYSLFHKYCEASKDKIFKIHLKSEMKAPVIKNNF